MATFNKLVEKVADWANRGDLVKTDDGLVKSANNAYIGVIPDFLEISMKRINNTLRIPPMEQIATFNVASTGDEITIPADMIEPIYIRTVTTAGDTGIAYSTKLSSRGFVDYEATVDTTSAGTYSRRTNKYIFSPVLEAGDKVELYYYRVLPDLDAKFPNGVCTGGSQNTNTVSEPTCLAGGSTSSPATWVINTPTTDSTDEVPQWFRDEQDEILLYGALAELFAYLGEDTNQEKWLRKFEDKIRELREEEAYREWRGGTIVAHIITNGQI